MNEIIKSQTVNVDVSTLAGIRDEFFKSYNANTRALYGFGMMRFREFLGMENEQDSFKAFLSGGAGKANLLAAKFRDWLVSKNYAPKTVNAYLGALRAITKLAQMSGMVGWQLIVKNVREEKVRDTRGPDLGTMRRLLEAAEAQRHGPQSRRDAAILWLMFSCTLRKMSIIGLDLDDVAIDGKKSEISVRTKGRSQQTTFTLPQQAVVALQKWLKVRGNATGPLFTSLRSGGKLGRLTSKGVYDIVKRIGKKIGIKVWPHALRHSGITAALDATNGDVRSVRQLSKHASIQTVIVYDDQRRDVAGNLSQTIADELSGSKEKR